jgi:hypothetical protein
VLQASGYDDPTHLIGSIPDHFFGALSDAYGTGESASICRKIFSEIKTSTVNDGNAIFEKDDARKMQSTVSNLERRLITRRIL